MNLVEFDFVKNLYETHEMMIKHTHIQFRSNLLNILCVVLSSNMLTGKIFCSDRVDSAKVLLLCDLLNMMHS